MKTISRQGLFRQTVGILLLLVVIAYAGGPSLSDDFTDRRITAGAKIFRALLAADVDIAQKTGPDGDLHLCLLYLNDTGNAERAAETLENRDDTRIRKMNVRAEIMPYGECVNNKEVRIAGIFLTQVLSDKKLKLVIEFAKRRNTVVFSPFEGDVERGVQSGIAVEARVRPYINKAAMSDAGIRLKPFFKRVAKQYEE